nr:hypothetical protein [Tanacetum cinerariifolium]
MSSRDTAHLEKQFSRATVKRFANGICVTCIYGDGKSLTCCKCEGMLKGGFCFPCNFNVENSYNCYQNANSFNDSFDTNYIPQPQYENYLCNLCGNNSHDGYDCQQQFSFVYKQEPSYNQNYDGNLYSHESPSFLCCDYCGGSHENFRCQPDNQNVDFSSPDQIQTPQYPDVNSPSPENSSEEVVVSNPDPDQEKEPEVTTDTELLSTEDIHPLAVQEPPREFDIRQLIRKECSINVCEEQKQKMEKTMFDLFKLCHHKELLCMYDNVEDLIESALNSKLLLINSKSQHPNEMDLEGKNVEEQPAEHEIECDKPAKDESSSIFMTFSNPLFKDNDDLDFSDDESLPDEDVPTEEFKIYSNPLLDEDEITKTSYNCYQNANSFNDSFDTNYITQPQYENYLCNLCGNNSHDGYDCQQQFSFVYKQEPSYNQNYDGNFYSHESPSFPCCDYCGGSHENFQCQPDNQNVDFSGPDQIQTPQYPDVNSPSPENSSEEVVVSNPDQEKEPELIRKECSINVCEEQKQKMEKKMFELVKLCHHKELLCMYDNVEDLIESALNSKLLLINSKSQHPNEMDLEGKNVEEQSAERRNRAEKSLQNYRVIHKNSISLNSTQISSVHAVAPILSAKEPDLSLSMGYEHPNTTLVTKVIESSVKNLVPIPSECEVTSEDEIECDKPAKDESSLIFMTFSNPLFKDNDDLDFSNDESLPDEDVPIEEFKIYSNPLFDEDEISSDKLESHCFNVESDLVESLLNRDTFIDSSSKIDFLLEEFSGELAHINPEIKEADFDFKEEIYLIENLLYDNSSPQPPEALNAEIADTIIESIPLLPILVQDDDVLPPSDDNDDDYDPLLEEIDLFLAADHSIPPGKPRPPPEPPDAETDTGEKIPVVMNDKDEDVDYSSFIFVIYPEMFPLLLSAKSEDTIFNPGLFSQRLKNSCVGYCPGFQDPS